MQEEWYVELAGAADGPHDRRTLLDMRGDGRINAATLVWRAGFADWQRYADAGLHELSVPPPLTQPVATVSSVAADRSASNPDAALTFDLAADEAPPIDSAFERENLMRRVIAERYANRSRTESIEGLPAYAPPLEVEDDGWQWVQPAPWRRYLARMLDVSLLGIFTWMVVGIIAAATDVDMFNTLFHTNGLMKVPLLSSVVVVGSLIPVQALLIGTSGTTIGKWIFGIRITRRDGSAIGFRDALVRELSVYGWGMACGVPLLSLIASLIAYNVLSKTHCTQWDRGKDWVVTQREPSDTQVGMFVLGVVALAAVGALVRSLQEMAQ
jgi:uncharacterized RDD family membrane protein YckC